MDIKAAREILKRMSSAYLDLMDPDYVFDALLGYGMFPDKLPPCFDSEGLLAHINGKEPANDQPTSHAHIEYRATKNTLVPRPFGIPHPESYWLLCRQIHKHWDKINLHIGKPGRKFNFCHVRRIKDQKYIFSMGSYGNSDAPNTSLKSEELKVESSYHLGCRYVVEADISTCFPSIYSHSISWAINGLESAKKHQCKSFNKRKKIGKPCKSNNWDPCEHKDDDLWANDLDAFSRAMKHNETNGLLIGPHSSNIISEIVLTQIDCALQKNGFQKVIRHIDDMKFFAESEAEAKKFLRVLNRELKKFELMLNAKKTKLMTYQQYVADDWVSKLRRHSFVYTDSKTVSWGSVEAYINRAYSLADSTGNWAAFNYALKVVAKENLEGAAGQLYVERVAQIALLHPYLLPLLEEKVFRHHPDLKKFLADYVPMLCSRSLEDGVMDAVAYAIYYALKYDINLKLSDKQMTEIVDEGDCISLTLVFRYCSMRSIPTEVFQDKAKSFSELDGRVRDQYWLFLYEVLGADKLEDPFLRDLKNSAIEFLNIEAVK
jgi:hypothetical protein